MREKESDRERERWERPWERKLSPYTRLRQETRISIPRGILAYRFGIYVIIGFSVVWPIVAPAFLHLYSLLHCQGVVPIEEHAHRIKTTIKNL